MSDLPRPKPYYVNIYPPFAGQCGVAYESRTLADQFAAKSRIACKLIQVVAGDGLEDPAEDSQTESANGGPADNRA